MRTLTQKEQDLYDQLINDINFQNIPLEEKETIIKGLDELMDELMSPYMDIDEALEYFGGGK